MSWDTVIGLEVHVQLSTQSKIFSTASTQFGAPANTQASFVDLALPGVLPVLNQEAINMAIKFGLSIHGTINQETIFSRKNYFYPDLPKGYQISQDAHPIVLGGQLDISMAYNTPMFIEIARAHLEEDAGKSTHEGEDEGYSGINLNRAGIPLLEVVTAPVIQSTAQAVAFLKSIRTLVRYLNISTGNMQEGAMRCDANISVRPSKEDPLGQRVEIKNINSFKFVERAIEYEVKRQIQHIESGHVVKQETRLYDAKNNLTHPMRSKEDAVDYRYFPDPDLPHVRISTDYINHIQTQLPELPADKCKRLISDYILKPEEARMLCTDPHFSDFFEDCVKLSNMPGKMVANWLCGEYTNLLKQHDLNFSESPITTQQFSDLLTRLNDETISGVAGKSLLAKLFSSQDSVDTLIESMGLKQINDQADLEQLVRDVIAQNPNQLKQYQSGKDKLFGYFVGQVMQCSKGRANPQHVNALLKKQLNQPE